jgi:hypothetical protein
VEKYFRVGKPHVTIWCMRTACWIPKATNIISEHVRLIAFPLQQWLHESTSMLRYKYNVHIVIRETQLVHCEVRTECLRMFPVNSARIGSPLSVSFYQRSSLISKYMLRLPEDQSGTAWELLNSNTVSEIKKHSI